MAEAAIFCEICPMRRAVFKGVDIKAGLDSGCSLTKIIFLPKNASVKDEEFLPMKCLTFHNSNFEKALHALKTEADLPDSGKLHVTGVVGHKNAKKIKEIIGLDVQYINEFATIGVGIGLLATYSKPESIFHPLPVLEAPKNDEVDNISAEIKNTLQITGDPLPAIGVYVGSGGGSVIVTKDFKSKFIGGIALSGRPFLGISKILLGTNNYDAITELASKGDRNKVDLLVRDVVKKDSNSPYGNLPLDYLLAPFGKVGQSGWKRDSSTEADLARSLICFAVKEMIHVACGALSFTNIKNVYFGGNFFRSEFVRKLLYATMEPRIQSMGLNVRFLRTGHTGAIAAMLLDEEKAKESLELDMMELATNMQQG